MKVELRGITKRFPGVIANSSVDLSVQGGEVHALLGENGAGKSTLMNILFGLYAPDEGEIVIDGAPVRFSSPADAIAAGIGMVHQHFMLVPVFTVTENVMLGVEETRRFGFLDRTRARKRLLELSEEYGLRVDPDAVVEDLPVGVQQRVEILKALYRRAECLILDEPTAVLTPAEIDDLVRVVKTLTDAGRGVIFISHKLNEVMAVADRITVVRRGQTVATTTPAETTPQSLAEAMVGRTVQFEVEKDEAQPGERILEVRDLTVADDRGHIAVEGLNLEVHAGEIMAIAGVQGNGQTELVESITGLRKPVSGTITIGGADVTGQSPRRIAARDVAHVPEDRQTDGLVLPFSIRDNLVLNTYRHRRYARRLRIDYDAVTADARKLIEEFDVRTPSLDAPASTLSGGNQQKAIIAREFTHGDRLLVAAQPTRGLDVGSIQYIHERLVAKRNDGAAVLLVSTELDEILNLADRVAVMFRGRIVGVVPRNAADRNQIGLMMAGSGSRDARGEAV